MLSVLEHEARGNIMAHTLEHKTRLFYCSGAHEYGSLMGSSGGDSTRAGSYFSGFCRFFKLLRKQT